MAKLTKRKISRLRLAAIGAVAAAALGYLIWGLTLNPPRPADLTHADPEVIEHIDDSIFALRLVPFSAERWATLGMVYEANGMEGPAAECYEHSLQWSEDERNWYRLAVVRKYHGDTDGALDAIDRALDLDPEYGPLHWRQGFWLLEDGQLDQAQSADRTCRAGLQPLVAGCEPPVTVSNRRRERRGTPASLHAGRPQSDQRECHDRRGVPLKVVPRQSPARQLRALHAGHAAGHCRTLDGE